MIKPIVHDAIFLAQKSIPATKQDLQLALDLQDTLNANRAGCIGMAANMIGVTKCAIIINMGPKDLIAFNPVITDKRNPYEAEEGCLSLSGLRKVTRYDTITLSYYDTNWHKKTIRLTGLAAEIAQHEIDHCNGILI